MIKTKKVHDIILFAIDTLVGREIYADDVTERETAPRDNEQCGRFRFFAMPDSVAKALRVQFGEVSTRKYNYIVRVYRFSMAFSKWSADSANEGKSAY